MTFDLIVIYDNDSTTQKTVSDKMNNPRLNHFESQIKSILDFDYHMSVNSRSSYLGVCNDISLPLAGDDGVATKQIAWGFDLLQGTYELNVVARSSETERSVWIGKGMSAQEAYANLAKLAT